MEEAIFDHLSREAIEDPELLWAELTILGTMTLEAQQEEALDGFLATTITGQTARSYVDAITRGIRKLNEVYGETISIMDLAKFQLLRGLDEARYKPLQKSLQPLP